MAYQTPEWRCLTPVPATPRQPSVATPAFSAFSLLQPLPAPTPNARHATPSAVRHWYSPVAFASSFSQPAQPDAVDGFSRKAPSR